MAGIDISKLDEMMDKISGGRESNIVKIEEGESKILRFIPDPENQPFRPVFIHYRIGGETFLCPKRNFDENSAILDFAFEMYGAAEKAGDEEARNAAKRLFPKTRGISPVLVRGEEEKGLQFWIYNYGILKDLVALVKKPHYGDVTDPVAGGSGRDFEVEVKKSNPQALYAQPHVTWFDRGTPLTKDEELYAELTSLEPIDYYEHFNRVTYEDTVRILRKHTSPDEETVEKYGGGASIEEAMAELEGS